ncbi:atherin-like [Falco biarmicus]|uniref:atherin-like n=1 Tax=Falco rusticolus TaxID=120794 RepID=UPI001886639A|nr:atherin-like [Falco rusticolus]XP_055573316.1 atherin-like [Falco cherrug]XP_056202056.1 atherin-like [Falco biarmicus]
MAVVAAAPPLPLGGDGAGAGPAGPGSEAAAPLLAARGGAARRESAAEPSGAARCGAAPPAAVLLLLSPRSPLESRGGAEAARPPRSVPNAPAETPLGLQVGAAGAARAAFPLRRFLSRCGRDPGRCASLGGRRCFAAINHPLLPVTHLGRKTLSTWMHLLQLACLESSQCIAHLAIVSRRTLFLYSQSAGEVTCSFMVFKAPKNA